MKKGLRLISTGAAKSLNRETKLVDSIGRAHDYLRLSLTERCNLRCRYCMPAEGIELSKVEECLSLPEIERLTSLFVASCGVRKIRLTGGEPTIDQKLVPLLAHLDGLRKFGLQTIALTTNGIKLRNRCHIFKDSGVDSVNISLDTLREDRFELITRRKGLKYTLDCIDESIKVGFDRVKLNCVVMRGVNDDELNDFVSLARKLPVEVRFIEFMPFFGNKWSSNLLVPSNEMLTSIKNAWPLLERVPQAHNETAKLYREPGSLGTVGFISSMTENFCSECNRLRLTADGNLKVCLFGRAETSLRDLIRYGATDRELIVAIQTALNGKKKQHAGMVALSNDVFRPMIKIETKSVHGASQGLNDSVSKDFTHLDAYGKANMVDIGSKRSVQRTAVARGEIRVGVKVVDRIRANDIAKGDIITVAKVAGIMGAKMTSNLIPMCHQVPLNHIHIDIELCEADGILRVTATTRTDYKTGVEMECLTAVSISLLTIYDMCKSVASNMIIGNITLVSKTKSKIK